MSNNPFIDYQEQFFKLWNDNMEKVMENDMYKNVVENIPGSDYYMKAMASMMPNVENYWKNMASAIPAMDYWKNMPGGMPDMEQYWKTMTDMIPGMSDYWTNISKMMPNPTNFAEMFPYKIPGLEAYSNLFDLWKSFADPISFMQDFPQKYIDITSDMIKNFLPEGTLRMFAKPMDFMNMMVEYYKHYVSPWMEIDPEIMTRISEGDASAYIDFFKDYQKKYEESIEKYFNIMGMGLNREANEDYMKAMNAYNKAMISTGELMAVIYNTSTESYTKIADRIQEELKDGKNITTFRDFYEIWYSVTEEAFEGLLATDEFAKVFGDFSDRYAQYMSAMNKVYERMLSFLPIPTNTDMKSLYKTVYDLRKEVRDLKKTVDELGNEGKK